MTRRVSLSAHKEGLYSVRVSDAPDDAAWDDFLEQAPGSAYMQTSCWGRARASVGWRPSRVVISEDGRVVAGVQMLTRRLPAGGAVGRVTWGPVVSEDHPDLVGLVFDEMLTVGAARGVTYLAVYPPRGCDWMSRELAQRGFRPTPFAFEYTATICVDLQPDLDELVARMRKTPRQVIRTASGKNGITIRRGSEADLPAFNSLKDTHAARLGYNRLDQTYYTELWRALAPRGHVELFIAEYEGEPVSACLEIPFGDTCYEIERPWSGKHGDLKPNELLEWHVLKWAKSEGYRLEDLGVIERPAAEATLAGERTPSQLSGAEYFKLAVGGKPVLLPEGYDYFYHPFLRSAYRSVPRRVLTSASMNTLVDRLRTRAWGRRGT